MVGTAFDYAFRFHLERLNPQAVARPWVAEELAYSSMSQNPLLGFFMRKAKRILEEARENHTAFLADGRVTDALLVSALKLGHLDAIYRSPYVDFEIGRTYRSDVADLRALLERVDWSAFTARRLCLLNPTFRASAHFVGGADADVVIDDMLLELKTTINPSFSVDVFHQLIGYYLLSKMCGLNGCGGRRPIKRLGVYFSRSAHLYSFDVKDVTRGLDVPKIWKGFQRHAKQLLLLS